MAIQSNFPAIRPSLLLDFANSKRLDPRITFTRASTARYYDGSTVAKAEENLILRSQEFDLFWSNDATTDTANQTTAPDGTSTADLVAETATTAAHFISQSVTVGVANYVFSVFAKKGTGATAPDWIQLAFGGVNSGYVNFNLSTGAVGVIGVDAASIENVGGGWYRCIASINNGTAGSLGCRIGFTNNANAASRNPSYAGATTSDVFLWGAQLEQRSAVTAYTATTTAPITNYVPVLQTAQNNVARFDHNPTTGESLGLLIEEQRTNILLQSEDFSTTWANNNSSEQTNAIVAPDGTLTGDLLIEDTSNTTHNVLQAVTKAASAITYTHSVYVKSRGRNVQLRLDSGSGTNQAVAIYDLSAGTAGSPTVAGSFTGASTSIVNVGNGWYRCVLTATSGTETTIRSIIFTVDGTNATYTGNGWSGIFIWGAQIETGAFATSYIPTTAASATRQADAASMTGTNFSSWYDAAEGTVYAESAMAFVATTRNIVAAISNATATNSIAIGQNTAGSRDGRAMLWVTANGNDQAYIGPTTTISSNVAYRFAGTYKVNDFATSLNAEAAQTDTLGTVPVVSQLNIGARGDLASGSWLNGTIRKLAYYPARLTNAQLQAITG